MVSIAASLLLFAVPVVAEDRSPEQHAMQVLDDFMTAFNARDEVAWTNTLHFPHVRIASGEARLDPTAEAMRESFDFDQFAARFEWDHSAWLSRRVVQKGPDKVHIVVRFARYRADGTVTAEFDSLYIVALRDGRWAIAGRSSFAP
jgi:hypothetical protein